MTNRLSKTQKKRKDAGYTMTELLVVLVIIALLVSLTAPRLLNRIGGAKSTTARTQIENISAAIKIYNLDTGSFPTNDQGLAALMTRPLSVREEDWQGPYMDRSDIPEDPWNRPYIYELSADGSRFTVKSLGKDGQPGGDGENEDVSNWD